MCPTDNMAYHEFKDKINKTDIRVIFELGSRDLLDAIQLATDYQSMVYAFECNPDCLRECHKNIVLLSSDIADRIHLIDKAVSITNGPVSFFSFDLEKYNNMGASSILQIDFTKRDVSDPDYNRENPQKEVTVIGTRLDTFIQKENIPKIDLICIDLQGYELEALKS
jgi:FkbM family methyltransferase